jgi:hypothetical protein
MIARRFKLSVLISAIVGGVLTFLVPTSTAHAAMVCNNATCAGPDTCVRGPTLWCVFGSTTCETGHCG